MDRLGATVRIGQNLLDHLDLETVAGAGGAQEVGRPCTSLAEVKIIADDRARDAEAAFENSLDEILGGQRGHVDGSAAHGRKMLDQVGQVVGRFHAESIEGVLALPPQLPLLVSGPREPSHG